MLATAVLVVPFVAFHNISPNPINPNATPAANALYSYLYKNYGNHALIGQTDVNDANWVYQQTGRYPAILAVDFMDYSPSRVAYGAKCTSVEDAIAWDAKGGIVEVAWHWNAPMHLYNSNSEPWYKGFYTEATSFDVSQAMNNPNSAEYKAIVSDLDAIAVQWKRLQAANVPVLWRPLHEPDGAWFWWGAKGSGPYKQLYALINDRWVNYHGINNLIWVHNIWDPSKTDWYPGDKYLDLSSIDIYASAGDHSAQTSKYNQMINLVSDWKMVAVPETVALPDRNAMQSAHADWSFIMAWSGSFINDGQQNSLSFLKQLYAESYILTLDEIQGWKTGGGSGGGPVTGCADIAPDSTYSCEGLLSVNTLGYNPSITLSITHLLQDLLLTDMQDAGTGRTRQTTLCILVVGVL
ncbi:hypothetical protein HDV00_004883 [Rhizophlyctis rosea]|nr:hypothetical protein HDV00_004883 [Rhizophlyctis rosea]